MEQYGLIKKAMMYGGEVRFMLTNSSLNDLAHELMFTRLLEAKYLEYKWQYSRLPNEAEFERLNWILGKELAYNRFEEIKKYRNRHGLRWKLMDRKTRQQHRKDLEKQFKEKYTELKDKVDWVKEKYSVVLKDFEFLHDVIEIICPMVVNWSYSNKLIVKPDIPRNLDVDNNDIKTVSQLVSILWIDRLGALIDKKVKNRLYYWYQQYLDARHDDAIIYPHPALDDRFFIGKNKMYDLKKELEGAYPELLTIDDDKLWSIIDCIKHNPHIKMNDRQKSNFHDIISEVGITLPDFMYSANGIQRFLERFHEIFVNEVRQPIIASSKDVQ